MPAKEDLVQRILVICVGNVCRSPMAEALLSNALQRKKVASAGIGALVDAPADPIAVRLMHERGLDLTKHRARQLDEELFRDSDLVLVMEKNQQEWIELRWPQARGRVYRWGHWSGFDVPDPFQRGEQAFREALALIDRGLEDWMGRL